MKVQRALVSVSDKTGLEEFVKGLDKLGIEIISTGGTAKRISGLGIPVKLVSAYTGYPEMLDGRVKTLNPKIHAGILALRDNKDHMLKLEENGILTIDMVVVNLYPFEETVSREDVTKEEAIENIDIGGPTMLRSAAKNYRFVAAVSSPSQYERVLRELQENGSELAEDTLKALAEEVFAKTSRYDALIARYLAKGEKTASREEAELPDRIDFHFEKVRKLRYGENPHQHAAFYRDTSSRDAGICGLEQLQGKELSFNNILDLNAAFEMVRSFTSPTVSIVKHNNPCGVATAETLEEAYLEALDSDPLSAFGSIMGFNGVIDGKMAETILDKADFIECIIAPAYEEEALTVFKNKKNLRLLKVPLLVKSSTSERDLKKIRGGALIQDIDERAVSRDDIKIVTKQKPSNDQLESLLFAWKVVKYVKSNAIVLSRGTKTVGIGAGQMSRVDSVIIAIRKAAERAKGASLASDAFFPKTDSIEAAQKAGISSIIQPGGSIRDEEIIEACNRLKIPMVFTGVRHFKH